MSELTNALITYDDIIARTDIDILRKIAKRHGFIIYDRGNYNLNIWGIRCDITDTKHFNDLLLVFIKLMKFILILMVNGFMIGIPLLLILLI